VRDWRRFAEKYASNCCKNARGIQSKPKRSKPAPKPEVVPVAQADLKEIAAKGIAAMREAANKREAVA
jgi:hypothetical protein